jgi:hypothetical protein
MLALIAGWDDSQPPGTPETPDTDWKEVPHDAEVLVYWRNKDRHARFKGIAQDGDLYVQIVNDAEVRAVARRKVTLVEEPALV